MGREMSAHHPHNALSQKWLLYWHLPFPAGLQFLSRGSPRAHHTHNANKDHSALSQKLLLDWDLPCAAGLQFLGESIVGMRRLQKFLALPSGEETPALLSAAAKVRGGRVSEKPSRFACGVPSEGAESGSLCEGWQGQRDIRSKVLFLSTVLAALAQYEDAWYARANTA